MKRILILMGRYLPGFKDGGPLRTIINVTEALGDEYEFYIACLDRDHGDKEPYPNVKNNEWNSVGKAKVWYVGPGGFTEELILKLAENKDSIYLTSFYDDYGYKTLWLKRKGKITKPITIASMGVFAKGAMKQKALKKKVFIMFCKLLGLFDGIVWSVTSEIEACDLKREINKNAKYVIAEDLPRNTIPREKCERHDIFRVVFLSRICAHKGLDIAIDAVSMMNNECYFTIYGPVQEIDYWGKCVDKLKKYKLNWEYGGEISSDLVQEFLSQNDVLILPTKSENYGHVIFEALSVGCIPVISPNTPWNDIMEKKVGFIVDGDAHNYAQVLDSLSKINLLEIKSNSVQYARDKVKEAYENTGYREVFDA